MGGAEARPGAQRLGEAGEGRRGRGVAEDDGVADGDGAGRRGQSEDEGAGVDVAGGVVAARELADGGQHADLRGELRAERPVVAGRPLGVDLGEEAQQQGLRTAPRAFGRVPGAGVGTVREQAGAGVEPVARGAGPPRDGVRGGAGAGDPVVLAQRGDGDHAVDRPGPPGVGGEERGAVPRSGVERGVEGRAQRLGVLVEPGGLARCGGGPARGGDDPPAQPRRPPGVEHAVGGPGVRGERRASGRRLQPPQRPAGLAQRPVAVRRIEHGDVGPAQPVQRVREEVPLGKEGLHVVACARAQGTVQELQPGEGDGRCFGGGAVERRRCRRPPRGDPHGPRCGDSGGDEDQGDDAASGRGTAGAGGRGHRRLLGGGGRCGERE
ncbi:hypothetical protein CLV63_105284 [Murinocardiopsis flavida]|uniref:Uncharacterized protein n=1 Tax=Murinocardiopsis flavida TaxID=645275 RepID=A0A2P8DN41_9ACTN|nr:hypothetical protein CLV63_105284 [Murinocardiopsis flavida]